jgi:hypothetical protein
MKTEFLFKMPRMGLMDLQQFEREMDIIITNRVRDDFAWMDKRLVEVFDKRQSNEKAHPPLRSLGKMTPRTILQKFT